LGGDGLESLEVWICGSHTKDVTCHVSWRTAPVEARFDALLTASRIIYVEEVVRADFKLVYFGEGQTHANETVAEKLAEKNT
jgi:hypothetical protein